MESLNSKLGVSGTTSYQLEKMLWKLLDLLVHVRMELIANFWYGLACYREDRGELNDHRPKLSVGLE